MAIEDTNVDGAVLRYIELQAQHHGMTRDGLITLILTQWVEDQPKLERLYQLASDAETIGDLIRLRKSILGAGTRPSDAAMPESAPQQKLPLDELQDPPRPPTLL